MWLFCFFDLPVKTKPQRREATRFRNFLLSDGFNMLQFSVYIRIVRDKDGADKHIARLCRQPAHQRQRPHPGGDGAAIRPHDDPGGGKEGP